jgi:hypothetical protein
VSHLLQNLPTPPAPSPARMEQLTWAKHAKEPIATGHGYVPWERFLRDEKARLEAGGTYVDLCIERHGNGILSLWGEEKKRSKVTA